MRIWTAAVATVVGLMLSVGTRAQEQREIRYEQCVRVIEAMANDNLEVLKAEVTPEVHAGMSDQDILSLLDQIKGLLPQMVEELPAIESMRTFYVTKETDAGFEEMENYAFIYGDWVLYFVYTESGGEKITGYNLTLKENIRSLN